jgi:amino acid transporter
MCAKLQNPAKVFARDATGLVREFGALDTLLLASVFVFALVFTITQFPWFYGNTLGANLTVSLLVAAVPFIVLMLAYWVIGVMMPRTGNDYVWIGRVFHPSIGFTWSLIYVMVVFLTAYIGAGVGPLSFAFSSVFSTYGLISNSSSLTNLGNFFGGATGTFELSVVFTVMVAAFAIFGSKFIKGFLYVTWIFAIGGMILMWYILGTTSNATFIGNWNSLMTTLSPSYSYSALQATAAAKTSFPGFSAGSSGILLALPFAFLFLFGGNYSNAFAGEIKNVRRSLPIALFLSLVFGIIYWSITSQLTVDTLGFNWVTQVGYGWITGGSVPSTASFPLPFQPTQPLFLAVAAYPNNTLITVMFLVYIIGSLGPVFAYFWIVTKYLFAWSFDRVIPSAFANVSDRFHTPYLAVIIAAVVGIILSYLFEVLGYATYFTMGTVIWGISYIVPGLALMFFPFVRKDLFANATGWMAKKVGGLPVISLIGALTAIGFGYVGYLALSNPAIGVANEFSEVLVVSLLVAGFLIYFVSDAYHRRQGMNMDYALKAIPPE